MSDFSDIREIIKMNYSQSFHINEIHYTLCERVEYNKPKDFSLLIKLIGYFEFQTVVFSFNYI